VNIRQRNREGRSRQRSDQRRRPHLNTDIAKNMGQPHGQPKKIAYLPIRFSRYLVTARKRQFDRRYVPKFAVSTFFGWAHRDRSTVRSGNSGDGG